MLTRFKKFLIERDITNVINKTKDVNPEVIRSIYDAIGDKFIKMLSPISRMVKNAGLDAEDTEVQQELPQLLDAMQKSNIKMDIGRYKDWNEFKDDVTKKIQEKESTLTTKAGKKISMQHELAKDLEKVFEMGKWKIYELKSWDAAKYFTPRYVDDAAKGKGQDMGWCTGDPDSDYYCKHYIDTGRLFIFVEKGKIRYQLFKENDSQRTEFMLPHNVSIDIDDFREAKPEFEEFFKGIGLGTGGMFIKFRGRKFPYVIDNEGNYVFETIDLSDMGLTSLAEFPWPTFDEAPAEQPEE